RVPLLPGAGRGSPRMSNSGGDALADLVAVLRLTDPAALLAPGRILRRIIKKHRQLGGLGLQVPHRKSYLIDRSTLLNIARPSELGLSPLELQALPECVLLLCEPDPGRLMRWPREKLLLAYWRLLFHLRVHRAFPHLTPAEVKERITHLGEVEFEEVRAVLA